MKHAMSGIERREYLQPASLIRLQLDGPSPLEMFRDGGRVQRKEKIRNFKGKSRSFNTRELSSGLKTKTTSQSVRIYITVPRRRT